MNDNYKIPHLIGFKLRFESLEPIIRISYKTSPRSTTHYETGLFNPIHTLIRKLNLRWQYYNFKRLGIEPEKCESCGTGWATWMIDEPNGDKYSITACDLCVDFYDWRMSRKKINYYKRKFAKVELNEKEGLK